MNKEQLSFYNAGQLTAYTNCYNLITKFAEAMLSEIENTTEAKYYLLRLIETISNMAEKVNENTERND